MKTHRFHFLARGGCLAALLLCLLSAAAHAQVTIYAKFADGLGSWNGGVTRPELSPPQQNGWVRLDSFSVNFTSSAGVGGGGAVTFNPAAMTKVVDRVTPTIFGNLAIGQYLRTDTSGPVAPLTVEFVKDAGAGPVVVLRVEMKLVFFTALSPTSSSGEDEVREEIKMVYGSARITTWPVNPGGTLGTPVERTWNQVTSTTNFDTFPGFP